MMATRVEQVDWSTAEVKDATLSVDLVHAPGKRWRKDFERVLALLGDAGKGDWGEVTVAKGRLRVTEVAEGAEADVRHFIESAMLQVNSHLGADPAAASPAAHSETPDQRMTATFRRFGLPTRA